MADIPASAANALFHYAEDSPHSGLYIPFQAAGAVEVITGAGGSVFQFHAEGISNADASL